MARKTFEEAKALCLSVLSDAGGAMEYEAFAMQVSPLAGGAWHSALGALRKEGVVRMRIIAEKTDEGMIAHHAVELV